MIDKAKVARSFSRSASNYDSVAYFQRDTGEHLMDCLQQVGVVTPGGLCVDLGCGTGHFRAALTDYVDSGSLGADYVAIDIAEGMLQFCRQQLGNSGESSQANPYWLCADAEALPLAADSTSLMFSNLAVQWCEQLPQLLAEAQRVLVPGGIFAFTTLGPQTLNELRQAWATVDQLTHVNDFMQAGQWWRAITASGFMVEQFHYRPVVLRYRQVTQLLRELKTLGAHNINEGQRQTLTGRRRLQQCLQAYEAFAHNGVYPATYEVYSWVLRKC